jgi:hypothetical protein
MADVLTDSERERLRGGNVHDDLMRMAMAGFVNQHLEACGGVSVRNLLVSFRLFSAALNQPGIVEDAEAVHQMIYGTDDGRPA